MSRINSPAMSLPTSIGIVIPAHNEAEHIADCLTAIQTASAQLTAVYPDIAVRTVVVLDSCSDDTAAIVRALGIEGLACDLRCVGAVRDLGVRHMIAAGATWIACTDADSQVPPDWLLAQLHHQPTDMICGVVSIEDWAHLSAQTKHQYLDHYRDEMGHQHIHGANLSFASAVYQTVGGFAAMPCHEDVDLVKKFQAHHCHITWSNQVRVTTSSRLQARANEGFAHFLTNLETHNANRD